MPMLALPRITQQQSSHPPWVPGRCLGESGGVGRLKREVYTRRDTPTGPPLAGHVRQ